MQDYEICPFELRSASRADYQCLNEFKNILRRDVLPEDPPISCKEDVQRWKAMPAYVDELTWAAWDRARRRIVAFGEAEIYRTGDNEHVLEFMIEVLPEFRRRGLARGMLRLITEHARRNNRRLMLTGTNNKVPAGAEFLSGMGARRGLEERQSQMRVSELDPDLIPRWLELSNHLREEFALGWWDGPCPEERLEELANLLEVVGNDQPRDTLDMEDVKYSPEIVRQFENKMFSGGQQHWALYAADRAHDRIAGLTEVLWNPARPTMLEQGFTGIFPQYRSRGLGRWLKAEMLKRVLRERPQVEFIRTGNADSNAPMLKINEALGYKPLVAWTVWQVETDRVEEYLAKRN